MEGLAGAAGVMAVGSITLQLADQFKKLHDFWTTFKDAPEDIRVIVIDMTLLLDVLKQMQVDEAECGLDPTTIALLRRCGDQVQSMLEIVEYLEPGFASRSRRTRVLNALKATFRQEKIKKCREFLGDTKGSLLLAQQSLIRYIYVLALQSDWLNNSQ